VAVPSLKSHAESEWRKTVDVLIARFAKKDTAE